MSDLKNDFLFQLLLKDHARKRRRKNTFLFIFISVIFFLIIASNLTTKNSTSNQETIYPSNEVVTTLKTINLNLGRLKANNDGYSIGSTTELTELRKQLNNKDYDIIEIIWVWDCSPKYADMYKKIIYNKTTGNFKSIYTETNVIEVYKNITPECLGNFLANGEKDLSSLVNYCPSATYDFNNREMK